MDTGKRQIHSRSIDTGLTESWQKHGQWKETETGKETGTWKKHGHWTETGKETEIRQKHGHWTEIWQKYGHWTETDSWQKHGHWTDRVMANGKRQRQGKRPGHGDIFT